MATTTYLWDPFDDNVVSEHDGTTETAYTHEPGQYGDLISQRDGTSSKFYHFDARGDTREITDESENVTDTRTYDAWGNVIASTGSTPTPYQFVGKLGYAFDATLDQYYVRARWYQQQVGRWMSEDPLGFVDGVNRYRAYFVPHDMDPSGLNKCVPAGGCALGRGTFTMTLGDYSSNADSDNVTRIGSSAWIKFSPDADSFEKDSCCCCTKIGFAQGVAEIVAYSGSVSDFVKKWPNGMLQDIGLPYPHGSSTTFNPCSRAGGALIMEDQPNAPLHYRGIGNQLVGLAQRFETCVVCMAGKEKGAVYGCLTWGHNIWFSKSIRKYRVRRWIGLQKKTGIYPKPDMTINMKPATGCGSDEFRTVFDLRGISLNEVEYPYSD